MYATAPTRARRYLGALSNPGIHCMPATIHENRMFEPDVLTPSQFFDRQRGKELTPEARLALAVLERAVDDYLYPRRMRPSERTVDLDEWFASNSDDWPFSFVNCCHRLGLDPDYVRRGVLKRRHHA
jgi:hypothetical protein